jgi:glucose-1-phosphatase
MTTRVPNETLDDLRLLVFDVGGVMVDGFDVRPDIAAHVGLEPTRCFDLLEQADFRRVLTGRAPLDEYWRAFSALAGTEVSEDLWGAYFRPVRRQPMYDLVTRLKRRYRVVAGTNTLGPHYDEHQRRGDYDVFDATYASHLIHAAKPDTAFYQTIVDAEGVAPEQTLFIDDFESNVLGARRAGLHALHFTEFDALEAELVRLLPAA